MPERASLPDTVETLVERVLTSASASSSTDLRRAVFEHVASLTRQGTDVSIPADVQTYIRKVALNAYKVLDREVDAMRAAGYSVDEVFEMTVAAAVSAGVTRMDIALTALQEEHDAPAA
jgi:alkylhydroperoxidase family enzyme